MRNIVTGIMILMGIFLTTVVANMEPSLGRLFAATGIGVLILVGFDLRYSK